MGQRDAGPAASAASGLVAGAALPPRLRVEVKAPERVAYDPRSLGPVMRLVTIRISNAGGGVLRLEGVSFSFSATRDGVPFPCSSVVGSATALREASNLAAGESTEVERVIDCKLLLAGTYAISLAANGERVAAFKMDVNDEGDAPRPYPGRPGLFLRLTGGPIVRPSNAAVPKPSEYPLVVAVINGGSKPIRGGAARLALSVCRQMVSLPCVNETVRIALPETLEPGTVQTVDVPSAGAPRREGDYSIDGRITLDDETDGVPIGRVCLKITRDATVIAPMPWPPVGEARAWPRR